MKKITLKTIYKGDKHSIRTNARKHSVCIKNGLIISFTDHRQAESFLSRTNEFLNLRLFELNELVIELHTQFRRSWYYFEYALQEEKICRSSFDQINTTMELMVTRSHYENGPVMVFSWMDQSFRRLITIIESLQEIHRRRNNWAEIKILESIKTRVLFILSQIETYR